MVYAEPVDDAQHFYRKLKRSLRSHASSSKFSKPVIPVGLFLLIDEKNGGDTTAEELRRRFNLLDFQSANVIDFYFLGWNRARGDGIAFNMNAFNRFKTLLKSFGICDFGGYADLILVDAFVDSIEPLSYTLKFSSAVHIDISREISMGHYPSLGWFLESIIKAAEEAEKSLSGNDAYGVVHSISDQVGLVVAKESILNFFLETMGYIIGASKIQGLAVKYLGPNLTDKELSSKIKETHQDTRNNTTS